VLTAARVQEQSSESSPRKQFGPTPLSYAQEQLWFLDQLTPGSPVYNMGDIVDFYGSTTRKRCAKRLMIWCAAHEILRTSFSHSGGQPVQVISPEMDLPLAELDLSSLSEKGTRT